jgi:hypothetical protein
VLVVGVLVASALAVRLPVPGARDGQLVPAGGAGISRAARR